MTPKAFTPAQTVFKPRMREIDSMKTTYNMNYLITITLLFSSLSIQAEQSYTFGIVPQQSASKLAHLWGPVLQNISEKTGIKLQFATAPNIPTFEKRLAEGVYDIAYMNPYHFTVFHESPGYEALTKARDKWIKGIIVVRKDSPIQELTELDNTALAFPAPAAFAASILTRSHLTSLGLDYTPKYVSSHDSVYRSVAKGLFPAGGGVIRTFENLAPEIRNQLRVLWTTNGYTPHAVAVHPRVDTNKAKKLQEAMLDLENTNTGKNLLRLLKIKGLIPATNADWDDVRNLNINQLSKD